LPPTRGNDRSPVGGGSVEGGTPGRHRKVSAPALSTTKRLYVGPPRGRSRGLRVARRGTGSTKRPVARTSYRRKAPRIVHSPGLFTEAGGQRSWLEREDVSRLRGRRADASGRQGCQKLDPYERPRRTPEHRVVGSGGSGRRRRETSCPSIRCAAGLNPGGERQDESHERGYR